MLMVVGNGGRRVTVAPLTCLVANFGTIHFVAWPSKVGRLVLLLCPWHLPDSHGPSCTCSPFPTNPLPRALLFVAQIHAWGFPTRFCPCMTIVYLQIFLRHPGPQLRFSILVRRKNMIFESWMFDFAAH